MSSPIVLITVDDARALGRVASPPWGGDFLFEPPADGQNWPWVFNGAEYLPSLKAAAPRGYALRQDHSLLSWTVNSGLWDDKAQPSGDPRTTYLHMYEGTPNAVGQITSTAKFPPRWCAWVYRYVAPEGTTKDCDFSIKMLGAGASWAIYIPTQSADYKNPYLTFDGSGKEVVVSTMPCDTTGGTDSGWQSYVVWCELTLNQWIIGLAINGTPQEQAWVFAPPGVDIASTTPLCADGRLQVTTRGQQIMAAVAPITYPKVSSVEWRDPFALDTRFGDVRRGTQPLTGDALVIKPTGAKASATVRTNAQNQIQPKVTFYTPTHGPRAVAGFASVILPAVIEEPTHFAGGAWESTGNLLTGSVSYTLYCTWKGNELRASLLDRGGALDWKGNNVVTLDVGLQTVGGTTPTLTRLLTAYLRGPARRRGGDSPMGVAYSDGSTDALPLATDIEAADYVGSRMKRKTMAFSRCFAGLLFADAIAEIGNRLGFASDRIVCTDAAGVYLPTPQDIGKPLLAFGENDLAEAALDQVCAAVGRVWGIDPQGNLFARLPDVYSGTPDFTLDASSTEEGKLLEHFSSVRDMSNFANNVFMVAGPEGQKRIVWAQNAASESDPTRADFIGDNFQETITFNADSDTGDSAAAALLKVMRFQDALTFKPIHPQAIAPGMFGTARIANSQIAYDSVWYVTEERGQIDIDEPNELGWAQEFDMVRVS